MLSRLQSTAPSGLPGQGPGTSGAGWAAGALLCHSTPASALVGAPADTHSTSAQAQSVRALQNEAASQPPPAKPPIASLGAWPQQDSDSMLLYKIQRQNIDLENSGRSPGFALGLHGQVAAHCAASWMPAAHPAWPPCSSALPLRARPLGRAAGQGLAIPHLRQSASLGSQADAAAAECLQQQKTIRRCCCSLQEPALTM